MFTSSDVSSQVAGYAPILVASAGLMTALVAGASRRDKREADRSTSLDTKTDKALAGLETALDRTEQERQRWESRALRAETRIGDLERRIDVLEQELDDMRRYVPPPQGIRPPTERWRQGDSSSDTSTPPT